MLLKKPTSWILTIFFGISVCTYAQKGARVGYIDMNVILESVEEYGKASQLLDNSIEKWKKEIELKKNS